MNCKTKNEKKSESRRSRPKTFKIPRREPSVEVPGRQIIFVTPDKTTCEECPCYPKDTYVKRRNLNPCLKSPLMLYELAAIVVDNIKFPSAFFWTVTEVGIWMEEVVGLPQYKRCIIDNNINGRRLLMLEDPSHLPEINIHDFQHIKMIIATIRKEYSVEFVRFARSVGLPARKPLTHCTWFKSRTGPSWGVRENWGRCDVLRWMKIIMPEPDHRDHWDFVWYKKPDFPKTIFARVKNDFSPDNIPRYKAIEDICLEYQVPRKFRFQRGIPDEDQMIWMEYRPDYLKMMKRELMKGNQAQKIKNYGKRKVKITIPVETRLVPKPVSLTGLRGDELILARRKMATPKFLAY